jgi:hypothetical protein
VVRFETITGHDRGKRGWAGPGDADGVKLISVEAVDPEAVTPKPNPGGQYRQQAKRHDKPTMCTVRPDGLCNRRSR